MVSRLDESGSALASSILPMEARLVEALPEEPGWQFEPKWDGFRCLASRSGDEVRLISKSGKPLTRYFPEVVANILALPGDNFILDGELATPVGSSLSFDALQLRLHPAESRVRKLARETPTVFIMFDMLMEAGGRSLMEAPLAERRPALERFFAGSHVTQGIRLSPCTRDHAEAVAWLQRVGGALDGVIAKRVDGAYEPGERAMLKVKRLRSADCVVGGFRYGSNDKLVGSLLLGLFDAEGLLHHVGFTSMLHDPDRKRLTTQLEKLKGPPGFTGRAPGGPSRWATERSGDWHPLKHRLVVEVRYDHVTDDRFRHGTKLLRWRPDKAPQQCTFEQLQRESRPGNLIESLSARDS